MDVPTTGGDVLAQPTRAQLFALLSELRRSASTEELAGRLGLHPNGIRIHLERLQDARLVVRGREFRTRGRPRDTWAISPDAQPGGARPTAYADLSRWLVRAISEGRTGVRDVEAAGRQIGRELAPEAGGDVDEGQMYGVLVALGFQPRRQIEPERQLTYRLDNCPYREAAGERQKLVCGLHRGLTRGLLDVIDPKSRLAGFVAKDPYAAGCLIQIRGPLAAQAAEQASAPGDRAGD